jgi:S-adenosylmethionine decarboxylase
MSPVLFEGPEKKVELVVRSGHKSLREVPEERWHSVVKACGAQVLSKISSEQCDAYLLSESSLFVFDDYLTMITCGRTLLVNAVIEIFEFVRPADVALLVYERKNEHFPREQLTSFEEDARRLGTLLPGQALRFGAVHGHMIELFHSTRPFEPRDDDTTLEILMHDIAEEQAACFSNHDGKRELAKELGLDALFGGFTIDEFCFEPAGYSVNAVRGSEYFTIHVTPESIGSYVSFETNVDHRGQSGSIIGQVVELFAPESFDVFSFAPRDAAGLEIGAGYTVRRQVTDQLCGYSVTFMHCYKPEAAPGRAQLISL